MADAITTVSSALPKTNINTTISTSSFTAPVSNTIIDDITLTDLQSAITKLSTYIQKVNNCGNCYNYTVKRTTCQSVTCQSATCQTASCQSTSCQSTKTTSSQCSSHYYNSYSCSC